MNLRSIAVFCGSSIGNDAIYGAKAYELAGFLAKRELKIVYGAGKIGVMGELANGALDHNAHITGVIPKFLTHKEIVHAGLTELILTDTMHERKAIMTELSDGFIVLPGGFGTMEEFFEVLTWAQLGLHKKPIGILNVDSYFDHLIQLVEKMYRSSFLKKENQDMILVAESISDLYDKMLGYKAPSVPKWLEEGLT